MRVEVDGRTVHAATGGVEPDPSQPAAVLVHGAGMNSTIWQLQTRYLAHRGVQALAVDLPGHGASDGPPLASIEENADWLLSFIDAVGVGNAHLIGHSMGALITLEAAARLGPRCLSLTLMGAAGSMPVHPQLIADAETDLPAASALMAAWGHAKPAHIGLNPTPGMWMTGSARALVERSDPGVLATDFRACAAYDGADAAARAVTAPTTILIGQGDKMTPPKAGRALAALIPGATVIELAAVGHSMMTEAPRPVREAMLAAVS